MVHGERLKCGDVGGSRVRSVAAYDVDESGQHPYCLVTSGSKLISGSADGSEAEEDRQYEVRVWDLETMACEHTVPATTEGYFWSLAAAGGEVWGGVGSSVVVWGRD